MINLIAFVAIASTLLGVVFWLIHNTNKYERHRREAPRKQQQVRQAELRRKLHQGKQDD